MTFIRLLGELGKIIKWSFITLLVVYLLLLGINAVDEDASAELIALSALPKVDASAGNGFLALVGLRAPISADSFDYGEQWVETYNAAIDRAAIDKANAGFTGTKLEFTGDGRSLCDPSQLTCLPRAKSSANDWRRLAADNPILIERLLRLIEFPRFEESYFPPNSASPLVPLFNPQVLLLDLIALDVADGHIELALGRLDALIAFGRRALLGANGVLMAQAARTWLKQDYALLAEIVATRSPKLKGQKAMLERMTEPFTLDQILNVSVRSLEDDSRFMLHGINEIESVYDCIPDKTFSFILRDKTQDTLWMRMREKTITSFYSLSNPFLKRHALQNLVAHFQTNTLSRVREFSTETADAWILQDKSSHQNEISSEIYSWHIFYNPVGKYIMTIDRIPPATYVLRLADLIGISRLARLQVDAVTQAASEEGISARLSSNKQLFNPYSGKPMALNSGSRKIYFDTHPQGKPERIEVGY